MHSAAFSLHPFRINVPVSAVRSANGVVGDDEAFVNVKLVKAIITVGVAESVS